MAVLENVRVGCLFRSARTEIRRRLEGQSYAEPLRWSVPAFVIGRIFLLTCAGASLCFIPAARAQALSEYQVKAAFLYNFTKFIEWPSQRPNMPDICIVGDDPFDSILEETLRGKTINGREIHIRRMKSEENARGCQIVFMSASERPKRTALEALQNTNTLTVGERPGFAEDGGIINFVIKDDRVHFEINVDAAERARLKISSKLLSLARIVHD